MDEILKSAIDKALKDVADEKYMPLDQDGWYHYEIYADYRDEFDDKTIAEMLESKVPIEAFYDKLWECYQEYTCGIEDEITNAVIEKLANYLPENSSYRMGFLDDEWCDIRDYIRESVDFDYPTKHYLNQDVYTDIVVDTGDMNYDFTLNEISPTHVDKIDDRASVVWLTKQQGYTKEDLMRALTDDMYEVPAGFLFSVRDEIDNETSSINALVILVRMKLEDLFRINTLMKNKSEDGKTIYNADQRPDCGTIVIDKKATLGLVDTFSGGGSLLEIRPNNDIELPIKYISEAIPDSQLSHYSIESIYDLWSGCWKDCLKKIVEPENAEVA